MYKRLIPSILLSEGRLVKGERYKDYRDAGSPATTGRAHNAQSADELVVCDVQASKTASEPDYKLLKTIAEECFMPLTIFGNISSIDRASKCMEVGSDKIGLTSAALDNPSLIEYLAKQYGSQAIVLGIDVIKTPSGEYKLYDHRTNAIYEDKEVLEWVSIAVQNGCGELRVMNVDREGSLSGLDTDLYDYINEQVNIPIILEGGAGTLKHIEDAYKHGVNAIALGAMLVFSDANLVKIRQHMRSNGVKLRP